MPHISVLVIAGTGRPYLATALWSLVHQDMGDWEAIVVEACAKSEDTAKVEEQIRGVNDPRIRVFSYDGDRSYPPYASKKWNFALARTDAPFVAFLDDDDMKDSGWLSAMVAPLVSDPNLWTTLCNGTTIRPDGSEIGPLFGNPSIDYGHLIRGNFVTTGQIMIRRRCLDEIGGLDGELSCAEDYDLCLRLAGHPWQMVHTVKCLKRDGVGNACVDAGGWTQIALRRIIAKHGAPATCHGCGKDEPGIDFVWCVDGVGFRNWHFGCTGLKTA